METIGANVASKRSVAETEMLYQVSDRLNQAETYKDVLFVFNEFSKLANRADVISLAFFDNPWTHSHQPQYFSIAEQLTESPEIYPKIRFNISDIPGLNFGSKDFPTAIEDIALFAPIDEKSRSRLMSQLHGKSFAFFPLVVGNNWLGYVSLLFSEQTKFVWAEVEQMFSLVEQSATAVQGIRFLRRVEARAVREQQIREIATKVRNATSVETILKTAAQEMGKALGRHTVVYLDPAVTEKNGQ